MPGGLDKSARLAQEAADAQQKLAEQTASLDPPFPFTIRPFDPDYFSLPVDPAPPKSEA